MDGRGALTTSLLALVLLVGITLTSCGEAEHESDVVESGIYTGTLMEVVPEEDEIYMETSTGETIELYFKEDTRLVNPDGDTIPFDDLSQGDRVEVEVERVGQRNDPVLVRLLPGK